MMDNTTIDLKCLLSAALDIPSHHAPDLLSPRSGEIPVKEAELKVQKVETVTHLRQNKRFYQ